MTPSAHSPVRTIDRFIASLQTRRVARYKSLIGKQIEISYRAGDIHLPASGVLMADSGLSVYLEDRFVQRGKQKTLRLEIPYQCIMSLRETSSTSAPCPPSEERGDDPPVSQTSASHES